MLLRPFFVPISCQFESGRRQGFPAEASPPCISSPYSAGHSRSRPRLPVCALPALYLDACSPLWWRVWCCGGLPAGLLGFDAAGRRLSRAGVPVGVFVPLGPAGVGARSIPQESSDRKVFSELMGVTGVNTGMAEPRSQARAPTNEGPTATMLLYRVGEPACCRRQHGCAMVVDAYSSSHALVSPAAFTAPMEQK